MNKTQNQVISDAFSLEAENYDFEVIQNQIMSRLREIIRNTTTKFIPFGCSILEINAGSGLDALWFAEHGYRIHATDIADGMLSALEKKIKVFAKPKQFSFQKLSFLELEKVSHAPFDGVFSNFGGLNCTDDLPAVVRGIKEVLKPNGYIVLVFMPKVSFWEMIQIFLGRINVARRRFNKNGTQANVRGVWVTTHYFSANHVIKTLGSDFELIHLQSLSLFAPPMNLTKFINKFPRLTKNLMRVDEIAGKFPLLNQCGDFLMLIARYHPK